MFDILHLIVVQQNHGKEPLHVHPEGLFTFILSPLFSLLSLSFNVNRPSEHAVGLT